MFHVKAIILIGTVIGALINVPCLAQTDESGSGLVEVEPSHIAETRVAGEYQLVPYGERRGKWGSQVSLGYGMFTPVNFASEFLPDEFDFIYGDAEMSLLEMQFTFKRNFSLGSIGLEAAVGIYQNSSDTDLIDSDLEVIPIRLGLTIALDRLFSQPYVVPYVSGGAYTMIYKETIEGGANEFGGSTQAAPYVSFGLSFGLDWIDPQASRESYEEAGIQATFLYAEARKYFMPTGARDPDFETDFEPSGGIRIEF